MFQMDRKSVVGCACVEAAAVVGSGDDDARIAFEVGRRARCCRGRLSLEHRSRIENELQVVDQSWSVCSRFD